MKTPTATASPLNAARGTALHRQIFLVLRDEISRGLFPDGALPNEEALCERFGVSRITVAAARWPIWRHWGWSSVDMAVAPSCWVRPRWRARRRA